MNEATKESEKSKPSPKGSYQMLTLQEIILDYFMLLETLIFDSSHCCFRIQHSEVSEDHRDQWDSGAPLENPNKSSPDIKCHKRRTGEHSFPSSGLIFKIILEEMITLAVIQHCWISDWNTDKGIPTWLAWAGFATVRDNISFSKEPH